MNCSGIRLKTVLTISRAVIGVAALGLMACNPAVPEPQTIKEAEPAFKIAESYLTDHPSKIWAEAARFLESGNMDKATLWFYAGQLRFRVLLDCPVMESDMQDLIVFSAQFETLEPKINNWAAQNLDRFVEILDDVLDWDESNIDQPKNYASCSEARSSVRTTYATIREKALNR